MYDINHCVAEAMEALSKPSMAMAFLLYKNPVFFMTLCATDMRFLFIP